MEDVYSINKGPGSDLPTNVPTIGLEEGKKRLRIRGSQSTPQLKEAVSQILKGEPKSLPLQQGHVSESRTAVQQHALSAPTSTTQPERSSYRILHSRQEVLITPNPARQGPDASQHSFSLFPSERPSSVRGVHGPDSLTRSPRLLRTSTSIPDYKTINDAFNSTSIANKNRNSSNSTRLAHDPQTLLGQEAESSVRESLRSALTSGSSVTEQSLIEPHRTWTDQSSESDAGSATASWPLVHDDEMSVEDAIDMYSQGFTDAPPPTPGIGKQEKPFAPSALAQFPRTRPTSKGEHAGLPLPRGFMKAPGPARASISAASINQGTTALMVSSQEHSLPVIQDRLKALIGPPRDRYGFKKESQHVKVAQYDVWNADYTKHLDRRRKRWEELMRQHGLPVDKPERFPPKSDKVKRYIHKGVPPDWRGAAWFFYAGGPARLAKYPGHYDQLIEIARTGGVTRIDKDHIERDLYRTFPDHIKFKPDYKTTTTSTTGNQDHQVETPMIISLRRILQAFAVDNPRIGYCQSLNFLAGYLLLFLDGNEEKAFHLLSILTSLHLPGTHGISLEGANVDIGVLMLCLRESMPALWKDKIDDRADTTVSLAAGDMRVSTGLPTVSLATTGWFMSCFASVFPVETTCRVWDCLFYEGSKTLFRVGLAIFKLGEREIRRTGEEPMEVFQVVQTLPKTLLDANLVIETATKKSSSWSLGSGVNGIGSLTQKAVEFRREERRKLYRVERERILLKALTMPVEKENGLEEKFKRVGEKVKGKRLVSIRGR